MLSSFTIRNFKSHRDNPALLDALPDDAVPHVVFCYRDRADGSSRLVRLMDLPDYPELIARGSVGAAIVMLLRAKSSLTTD